MFFILLSFPSFYVSFFMLDVHVFVKQHKLVDLVQLFWLKVFFVFIV